MRTIESGCAVVDIVAWPEEKPWEGRYQTISSIEKGICRLVLSTEVFHDETKANTAYRRFAGKIIKAGLVPPKVEFRRLSPASSKMFCILTPNQSVFNSACLSGRVHMIESGKDEKRKICAILL